MERTVEIELRYQVVNPRSLEGLIRGADYKENRQVDNYYDLAGGDFYKRGIFIRVRNGKKLDFKFNMESVVGKMAIDDHTHCDEYSFIVPFEEMARSRLGNLCNLLGLRIPRWHKWESFLSANQLQQLLLVNKIRKTLSRGGFEIGVDTVAGVGSFLEVEKLISIDGENDDVIEQSKEDIRGFISTLGIEVEPLATGYFELILRKQDFDLYRQGKYVLEKDKEISKCQL